MSTKTIAVTGGMGCGQSTVCNIFEGYGCKIINADLVAKQIVETNQTVIENLKEEFGEKFFDGKELKRKELARFVFADNNRTHRLNEIIHPVLVSELIQEIEIAEKNNKYKLIILDAALIYELSIERFFDAIVVVNTPFKLRVDRIIERDGLTRADITDRINNQLPLADKASWGDYVVKNNSTLEVLEEQVKKVFEELMEA